MLLGGRTDAGVHALNACFHVDLLLDEITAFAYSKSALSNTSPPFSDAELPSNSSINEAKIRSSLRLNPGGFQSDFRSDMVSEPDLDRNGATEAEEQKRELQPLLLRTAEVLLSTLKEFACNGRPGTVCATRVTPVPKSFDAKFSVRFKVYEYTLLLSKLSSPFLRRFAWQIDKPLIIPRMRKAVDLFSGMHDFGWLAVMEPGENRSARLEVSLELLLEDPGPWVLGKTASEAVTVVKIRAKASYFLYKLVRRLVGNIVAVGLGEIELDYLEEYLKKMDKQGDQQNGANSRAAKTPRKLLKTAPAAGLVLQQVCYDLDV